MTSQAQAVVPLAGVHGLAFLGFPRQASCRTRGSSISLMSHVPMLFIQGTRDRLTESQLLEPAVKQPGKYASLHQLREADHSFHVPARSGRNDSDAIS
jgi:uncharacterized protein